MFGAYTVNLNVRLTLLNCTSLECLSKRMKWWSHHNENDLVGQSVASAVLSTCTHVSTRVKGTLKDGMML